MAGWIVLSIFVKIVCAASLGAFVVGLVRGVKAIRKGDQVREHQGVILMIPSAIVFVISFIGASLVDAVMCTFF